MYSNANTNNSSDDDDDDDGFFVWRFSSHHHTEEVTRILFFLPPKVFSSRDPHDQDAFQTAKRRECARKPAQIRMQRLVRFARWEIRMTRFPRLVRKFHACWGIFVNEFASANERTQIRMMSGWRADVRNLNPSGPKYVLLLPTGLILGMVVGPC